MVAEDDAVGGVAIAHEKAIATDDGLLAVGGSGMDGHELAQDGAIADFNIGDGTFLVFKVLRFHPDARVREDLAARADGGVSVNNCALLNHGAVADADKSADVRVGPDLNVRAEPGAVLDNCGWMDFRHFYLLKDVYARA